MLQQCRWGFIKARRVSAQLKDLLIVSHFPCRRRRWKNSISMAPKTCSWSAEVCHSSLSLAHAAHLLHTWTCTHLPSSADRAACQCQPTCSITHAGGCHTAGRAPPPGQPLDRDQQNFWGPVRRRLGLAAAHAVLRDLWLQISKMLRGLWFPLQDGQCGQEPLARTGSQAPRPGASRRLGWCVAVLHCCLDSFPAGQHAPGLPAHEPLLLHGLA